MSKQDEQTFEHLKYGHYFVMAMNAHPVFLDIIESLFIHRMVFVWHATSVLRHHVGVDVDMFGRRFLSLAIVENLFINIK